jgi:hypothetical protein
MLGVSLLLLVPGAGAGAAAVAGVAADVELRAVDAECWEGVRDGGIPRVAASWRVGVLHGAAVSESRTVVRGCGFLLESGGDMGERGCCVGVGTEPT